MGDMYATSALTIIAAAGDDPHHGLPGVQGIDTGQSFLVLATTSSAHSISTWSNGHLIPHGILEDELIKRASLLVGALPLLTFTYHPSAKQ